MLIKIFVFVLIIAVYGGGFALAVAAYIRERRKVSTEVLSRQFPFTAQDRLIVLPCRTPHIVGALLSAGIAGPMALWVYQGISDQLAIPIFFFVVATATLVHFIKMLLWKGPLLTADKNGILYRRWSNTVIPWEAVRSLKRYEYKEGERILLSVDHAYPGDGFLNKLGNAHGANNMYVTLANADHRLGHLLAAFRVHRPDLYSSVVAAQ